ncbi:hypothetical protein NUM3379_05010 [Kineococcus sp. NUM-3379]
MLATVLAFTALGLAVRTIQPTRDEADSRRALAAAQAGVDDFVSRLNGDETYYQRADADTGNEAATAANRPRGAAVPGSATTGESFRYEVLNEAEVPTSLTIRLKVTGYAENSAGTEQRTVIANLKPDSFLNYIYVTDLETETPEAYAKAPRAFASSNGGAGSPNLHRSKDGVEYYPDPTVVQRECAKYHYTGRPYPSVDVYEVNPLVNGRQLWSSTGGGPLSRYTGTEFVGEKVSVQCADIPFIPGDVINGPLHTNDSIQLIGPVSFMSPKTETSWNYNPANGRRWWGGYNSNLSPNQPRYAAPIVMPQDNSALLSVANSEKGCTYRGATKITLRADGTMQVWSPSTVRTVANARRNCLGTTPGDSVPVPEVVYVADTTTCGGSATDGTSRVGYPLVGEATNGPHTPDFACQTGDVYVQGDPANSGRFGGRLTIAAGNDIIVTGDIRYAGDNPSTPDIEGSDVLGLIGNRNVWIYHPVSSTAGGGTNHPGFTTFYRVDAALLALRASILVQNWELGASLSPNASNPNTKLTIRGSMTQKYRGRVADYSGGAFSHGYLKNYTYDPRLPANPPPYFIRPESSPWYVEKVTDR